MKRDDDDGDGGPLVGLLAVAMALAIMLII
jgi:hypothetical protein